MSNKPAKIQGIRFDLRCGYGYTKYLIHYLDDSKPEEWMSQQELQFDMSNNINGKKFKRYNAMKCVRNLGLSSPFMDVLKIA